MYLVKLRRRRISVPYSAIWQRLLAEQTVRGLWRRLKRWITLILLLVILFCILFALRDPRWAGDEPESRHVVVLIDASGSMAATDMAGGGDRIESARRAGLEVLAELDDNDRVMIVKMDAQIRPLTPFVRPSALLEELITDIVPTATRADLLGGVQFGARSLVGRSQTELVVITDGAFDETELTQVEASLMAEDTTVRFIQVGIASGNVAISAFNVRQYPANRLNYEVFVEVRSYFELPVTVELTLSANGTMIDRQLLRLEQGDVNGLFLENLHTGGSRIVANIAVVSTDAIDRLATDDVAYAVLPQERRTNVLLVTEDNLFVEAPFRANQNLDLTVVSPSQYDAEMSESLSDYDVVVFNDFCPLQPQRGNFLYIHPNGEHSPWEIDGELTNPIINRFDRQDPLMRWIHGLEDLRITAAAELELTDDDESVARSIMGDSMIIRRVVDAVRMVAVAFKIEQTDFALRPDYPLFLLNSIDWLTRSDAPLLQSYATGQAYRVFTGETEAPGAWAVSPSGDAEWLELHEGHLSIYPEAAGFYEIFWGDQEESGFRASDRQPDYVLGASFNNALESEIAPVPELPFEPELGPEMLEEAGLFDTEEPWIFLVLFALGLLVVEWLTFHRRITV